MTPPAAPGPLPDIDAMRAAVLAVRPELKGEDFRVLTAGWDSAALDGGGWIFKFPRNPEHASALVLEAHLLDRVRPAVAMALPEMVIHHGPPLFSAHRKLVGEHLLADDYARLTEVQRDALAEAMARFYAELHAMDQAPFRAAGVGGLKGRPPAEVLLASTLPKAPAGLHGFIRETLAAWQKQGDDPHGTIFGYFDGHGWNMAFDHAAGRLNGIYDFGDCAFGDLHAEFVSSTWIGRDLTRRIAGRYERATGRAIDLARVEILSGVMRLAELAQLEAPEWRERAVAILRAWADGPPLG